jgi:hypothetical protein
MRRDPLNLISTLSILLAMVCHLQAELSRRVRSDGGARRYGRTYHRFAMGPTFRSRLREKVEELCAPSRLILESR